MASIEKMTIPQFLNGNYHKDSSNIIDNITIHLKRHKVAYRIIGTTIFIFLVATDVAFAASTGIDAGGRRIYAKILQIAKWTIIFKGGWGTISNTLSGDFETAKKSFLQYLMIYVILLGLPFALDEIDNVFKDI